MRFTATAQIGDTSYSENLLNSVTQMQTRTNKRSRMIDSTQDDVVELLKECLRGRIRKRVSSLETQLGDDVALEPLLSAFSA